MKNVIKYLCAVLMIICTSASAWAYTPGSGYTKVTSPSSQLSQYDQVILYEEATGMGVTGSDGTDATLSSTEAAWTIYNIQDITGSVVELGDVSSSVVIRYIDTESESTSYKFVYSSSAASFTISNTGLLQYSGTRLAHNGNHIRFYSSDGNPLYVYKLNTPNPLSPASNAGLEIGPASIYMSGKSDNGAAPYGLFYSGWISYETSGYKGKNHQISIIDDDDFPAYMYVHLYDEYDEYWAGYFTPSSTTDFGRFRLYCYAPAAGVYHATLKFIEYGTGNYVEVPIVITVTADCTTNTVLVADAGSNTSTTGNYGTLTSVALTVLQDGSGDITWTSTNTNVATVSGNNSGATVTIVGAGTASIKASAEADATYCDGEATYSVTVNAVAPTVTNFTATCTNNKITVTNANASTVSNKGGKAITRYGYLYSTSVSTPTFGASGVSDANVGTTDVTKDVKWAAKDITGLSAGTTYYVRAYAYNGSVYGYSSVVTVTTKCAVTYAGNGGTGTVTDASSPYAKGSNVTVLANGFTAPDGKKFVDWLGSNSTHYASGATISSISTDITLTAQWTDVTYSDYKFSCAELTLTKAGVDTMFITSTASKSVRSQEAFHLTGSGLTPSTEFTFSFGNSDLNDRFAFKLADGSNVATNGSGAIDADIYVVYTPASGDGSDGLNIATNLTVTMSGAKPKSATLNTKTIIGRHLPEKFVIAAKKNGKWYALPSDMAASTPSPVEIAVDDSDNPTIAYTATDNMYSLYDQSAGEYIKLAMQGQSNAPLFGSTSTAPIGKSGDAIITNTLGNGYLWKLVQSRATGLTNAKEAKYTIYCKNNSTNHLRLKDDAGNPKWGLYDAGIDELRLIPASNATVAEAYFIEYSTNGGVIEVDAGAISATKVLARFNGQTSGKIDLVQTCTSGKNRASIYNYTVTFNGGVNFAAKDAAGKILMLEWYNSSNELVGVTSIEMPRIIASSTTMSGYDTSHGSDNKGYWSGSEVHILPDVTLTGNLGSFSSGGEIKELHIYPGATFKITTGAATRTMHVGTLVLRNGWSRAGSKRYDVARVHIATTANLTHTNAYADWYIDYDQYYPMAVPWDVTVSGISYRYTSLAATVGHDKNIRLRYYDGALRVNGGNGTGTNWRLYGDAGAESVPATLKPSQGYAITAKRAAGKAFAIVRMPLTFADTWTTGGEQGRYDGEVKDTVHVVAHGVGANPAKPWYAVGWNFIGNPYMSCFDSNEDDFMNKLIDENGKGVKYATIPDTEFEGFDQVNIASVGNKLKPSSGFFVQVGSTGSLRFKQGQIITPSAPARYTNEQEVIPEQEAFILLNGEQGHDQMGLVIGSDYTADYEMNADLSKMLGNANIVKTWMRYTDMDMAYVAINEQLAREWIPVTVHIPAEGEYTYSLMNSSTVDELEGLYLIDYETGAITNLIYDEYIFTAEAGTQSGRFAINAIVGERKVPTGADITGVDKNGNEPVKFIWHDKVYILHNNVIYDSTGKRVNVINK